MLPVGVKVPVVGLYNSALARSPVESAPPATSTVPLLSSVAVWPSRALFMLPVGVKVPVVGLYNSALASLPLVVLMPPAINTIPLLSNVALGSWRPVFMLPVGTNVPCCAIAVLENVVRLAHSRARTAARARAQRKRLCIVHK